MRVERVEIARFWTILEEFSKILRDYKSCAIIYACQKKARK
ncbi:MAG: hypothetical protein WCJ90_06065 [Actinomycetes bacterium]